MADGTKIEPSTSPEELRTRVGVGPGEKLRNSSRRESYLQKIAGLIALRNVRLFIRGEGAHVKLNKDVPEINVTGNEFSQPITDISQDEYDLLCQEVLTLHEDGHVLFSDWPSFERYMNRVDMKNRHLFKHIWNAAEDGSIERQITSEFSVRDDFRVFYANIASSRPGSFGIEQQDITGDTDDNYYKFPFAHAVITAILEMWTDELYDVQSGAFKALIDPDNDEFLFGHPDDRELFIDFLPEIEQYVADMLTTPRARARNKRTFEFWELFEETMDESKVSGKQPLSGSGGGFNGMPDDAKPGMGESQRDADSLDGDTVIIEVDVPQGGGLKGEDEKSGGWGIDGDVGGDEESSDGDGTGGDEEQNEDSDDEGGEQGKDAEDGEESDSDESANGDGDSDEQGGKGHGSGGIEKAAQRVKERYAKEIDREAEEVAGDDVLDEAEKFLDILKKGKESGKMPDPNLRLVIPESDSYNTDRYEQARNDARALERLWKQKLRMETQSRTRHGQRFGTPDSRSMYKSGRSTRVFKKRDTPERKDYECIVVLDRSSSMSGNLVRQAERAAGALLMSLYSVGVNVSMISLDSNEAVLEVPFGGNVNDRKNVIFTESNGGSTPLAEATYLARHRINNHSNRTRFMIVITDGRPDDSNEFRKQVGECNFPVLGVQIGGQGYEDVIRACTRSTKVPSNGNILSTLRNLVNEVMF